MFQQATVVQLSNSGHGVMEVDGGGVLQFGEDNIEVGKFHDLTVGQRVWFTPEQVHGPHPRPLQIRLTEPREPEPVIAHDHDDEA